MEEDLPPMELAAPDIERRCAGNTGIDHVTSFDSGLPGPHVLINALCHGNELSGAIAVDRLLRCAIRPLRGRLSLCLANVAAFRRFNPGKPLASRCVTEDFNRLWSEEVLDGPRDSVELRRARQLRSLYVQADVLLDLHSMLNPGEPLMLCGQTARGRDLALALGFPYWVVADKGHLSGRRLIEFSDFARPDGLAGEGAKVALLAECGQHWAAATAEVAFALCLLLLRHFGQVTAEMVGPLLPALEDRPQRLVEVTEVVTASSDGFAFTGACVDRQSVAHAGSIIGYDQGRAVRTPYDNCIPIMPVRKALRGQTVVRLGREVSYCGR